MSGLGMGVNEWFLVNVGLRHGNVMCRWLSNVYMNGVVLEVNAMVFGKGLDMLSANRGRFQIN